MNVKNYKRHQHFFHIDLILRPQPLVKMGRRIDMRPPLTDMGSTLLPLPTLFITGGEDTIFPPFLADAIATLMPNAKVEQVREAGHSVYFQRPSIFNHLVDRFFAAVG